METVNPVDWIGRHVEVSETKDKIGIQLDFRGLVTSPHCRNRAPARDIGEQRPARASGFRVKIPSHPLLSQSCVGDGNRTSGTLPGEPSVKVCLAGYPQIFDRSGARQSP